MHRSQENTALRAVQSNRHPKPSISRQRELQTTPIHMRDVCPVCRGIAHAYGADTALRAPPQGRCAANAKPMERKRDASREARIRSTQGKSHPMGITIAHGPSRMGRGPGPRCGRYTECRRPLRGRPGAHTRRRCTRHSFAPLQTSLRSNDSGSWSVNVVSAFRKHRLLFADKP